MSESVHQPQSYTNFKNLLSSINGAVSQPTVVKYIEGCEDAWLILRLRNICSHLREKETSCKYYFIDNGILNLHLDNGKGTLLENAVALSLFRKYGHDNDNQRVFFYNDNVEVDFYVPEDNLAIQVAYSIYEDDKTCQREVNALTKFEQYKSGNRRIILTNDESDTIKDEYGTIEVIPLWKWILDECLQNREINS
jgi:predicted AAA+ superfamily ATPase